MVLVSSTMAPLGSPLPDFDLVDAVSGKQLRPADFDAPVLVVMFLASHCPYVQHVRARLAEIARERSARGVAFVAISSNDAATHPQDGPEGMRTEAREQGYVFPYLFDAGQEAAKAFTAACTPDFFVYDAQRRLVYRGQFDASRPGSGVPVTGADLLAALDALEAGRPVASEQRPSLGCNIKWKEGAAPAWFGGVR